MSELIKVNNLHKIYIMGSEKVHALNGINLSVNEGEMICLLGPSGSGKSTLLNALAGLEKPDKGEIIVKNIHLEKLSESQITLFRSLNVGFVFQTYNLIPTLNSLENVSLGLMFKGVEKKKREKMAKEILIKVGLKERLYHKPNQLSGGQQQRVAIARAFVGNPKIVFADEPTGNLDTHTSYEIMDLIKKISKENNQTVIIVTHDEEMTEYADRLFHMRDGQIERIAHNTSVKENVNGR